MVTAVVGPPIHTPTQHVVVVPIADVIAGMNAGAPYMLSMAGANNHIHTLTVMPADFTTLKNTGSVMVVSSTDAGHMHTVTLTC